MSPRGKAQPTPVGPGFPPLFTERSRVLLLGSFPSPKSREQGFFYGHPQNRFWPLMAALTGEPVPDHGDLEAKKHIITAHGFALWDVIERCTIVGASDASVRDAMPNDLPRLLAQCPIEAVFCNGSTSHRLYQKYLQPVTGLQAVRLPSTSPANAAWSAERLREEWGRLLAPYLAAEAENTPQ